MINEILLQSCGEYHFQTNSETNARPQRRRNWRPAFLQTTKKGCTTREARTRSRRMSVLTKHSRFLLRNCDGFPQKVHKVGVFWGFFFFFFDILRFWQKWNLEKNIFNLIHVSLKSVIPNGSYGILKLMRRGSSILRKNAFEDICVDDGRKTLATGTKYKPKQTKVSKHGM